MRKVTPERAVTDCVIPLGRAGGREGERGRGEGEGRGEEGRGAGKGGRRGCGLCPGEILPLAKIVPQRSGPCVR